MHVDVIVVAANHNLVMVAMAMRCPTVSTVVTRSALRMYVDMIVIAFHYDIVMMIPVVVATPRRPLHVRINVVIVTGDDKCIV